jgi:hypothetical protein
LPLIIITRMWRAEHPFTREVGAAREAQPVLRESAAK